MRVLGTPINKVSTVKKKKITVLTVGTMVTVVNR
jgi:hypothetical protein